MNSQKHFFYNKKSKDNLLSNIEKVINYIYTENFYIILKEEQSKFLSNIETQVIEFIKHQYRQNEFLFQRDLSLYEKTKDSIKTRYESDFSLLNQEYIKYKKFPNKVSYLEGYRKHCFNCENTPTHKCSANKFGKFIEVSQKNNNNISNNIKVNVLNTSINEKNVTYFICTECSTCFMNPLIKAYCPSCKYEYITSKLEENENGNLLPATWKEYHCQPIIVNEMMKCIKCENNLYINLQTKKLVCLNKKCNFTSNPQSIMWKCKICKKDFRSSAKVFNPIESKILQKEIWKSLLYKEPALPKKLFCCMEKEKNKNIKYFHDKKCKGELYKGWKDGNEIVICSLCHAVNFNEKFIWTCPICHLRFNCHGKKHGNENNKHLLGMNNSKKKNMYSLQKYNSENKPFSNDNKNDNNDNNDKEKKKVIVNIGNPIHKHNYSTNIKLFKENGESNNTNIIKKNKILNHFTIPSIEISNNTIEFNKNLKKEIEFIKKPICISNKNCPSTKFSKRKKVRYQTLLDILEEREKYKISNDSGDESINKDNLKKEKKRLNEYYSKKRLKLLDQSKPKTSKKKDKKPIFQKYFISNKTKNILINNLNSQKSVKKKVELENNIINISDTEDKKILENNENENDLNEYESLNKNLHKKLSANLNNYSSKIIGIALEAKDSDLKITNFKDKLYSKVYKDDQNTITNEENETENENEKIKIKSKSKHKSKNKSKNKNMSKNKSFKYKINIDKKKYYLRESNNNNIQNIFTKKSSDNQIIKNMLNNDIKDEMYYTNYMHMNDSNNNENKENKNNNKNDVKIEKIEKIIKEEKEINVNLNEENNKDKEIKLNIKVYKSSRLKRNQIFKKIFLNKIKNKNNMREKERSNLSNKNNNNKIVKKVNNNITKDINYNLSELKFSPFGEISQEIISKDEFLKLANECTIPTFNEKNIDFLNPIGQGAYGIIYSVEEKNTKKQFALKSILCQDIEQIKKHKKEFELSYSITHENMIKIYNVLFKYLDLTTYLLYVLMEKAETDWNTEIEKRIKTQNFYTENELIDIMKQLVKVLCFFQMKNIAHRDIKPQNILICKNNIYKITDLGEAKHINNNNTDKSSTLKGSQLFMSPNLFLVLKYDGNRAKVRHNIFKSDVFSLGYCFLYAMSLDLRLIKYVREETSMIDVFSIMTRFGIEKKYSEKFMNIIYKMIQTDENKRYDFIELNEELNNNF